MNSVISTRTTLPEASCVLIKAEKKHVEFTATDLDSRATVRLEAKVSKPGAIAVSAYTLHQAITKANSPDSEFSLDGDALTIVAGKSRFKIYGLAAASFPPAIEVTGAPVKIELDGQKFAGWCERLIPFTPKGTERPEFQSICLDVDDESKLLMFSTNGRCSGLVATNTKCDKIKKGDRKNLPSSTIQKLLKFSPSGSTVLEIYENAWRAIFNSGEFTAKQSESSYPDFQRVVQSLGYDKYDDYAVSTSDLREIVSASSVATDQFSQIILTFKNDTVSSFASSHSKSEAVSEAECECLGPDKSIKLSSEYLQDSLKRVKSETLCLKLGNPERDPLVFQDEDHTTIIMLMRNQ
jgi:DNA polymerase III sliding clamp (beta) subunit (PCNA family)